MQFRLDSRRTLTIVLWLTAVHSFAVGIGLLVLPDAALPFFGFETAGDRFFRTQGGVFHLVMVIAYVWAAREQINRGRMVDFVIVAKFAATLFLLSYYTMVEPIWSVLGSAFGDFALGALILLANQQRLRETRREFDRQASATKVSHA